MKAENVSDKIILERGVEEVIEKNHLAEALASGKKLRVKLGIDPTAPDIHLGHTVPLRKLRQFQDAGHQIVLIIGDFTAMVGDPSGRTEGRKPLSEKEVQKNMETYLVVAQKVIDIKKTEVRYNSEWHKHEGLAATLELARAATFQQVIKRADFQKRLDAGNDITMLEILYPLLQGYDSVKINADVELGGTDQKFNLLMGRRVQRHFGQPEQDIMTLPLLEGTDGFHKMSKSYGNYISIDETPDNMFGKTMTVPDTLIRKYFTLLTEVDMLNDTDPYSAKLLLAETLAEMYAGKKEAAQAKEKWIRTFSKKEAPEDATKLESPASTTALELVVLTGTSKSEARRLIEQNAVELDGAILKNPTETPKIKTGSVLKVGKKKFFRLAVKK
ncbi:MAG: tyrosine--tRNA ligase [Patescibacteria group bacterium]